MQILQAAQSEVVSPAWRFTRGEPYIWKAVQQRLEGQLTFDPGKRSAKAIMAPPRECHMTIVVSGEVETVGIGEALRITVGRAHHRDDGLTLANELATQLDILGGQTRSVLAGALVAQELFNRVRQQGGIGPQSGKLIWMTQQRKHTVANEIGRGLLASHHRDDDVCDYLFVAEAVALDVGPD